MHLYYPDGKPCYEVPYADPKKGMRKATLADARKIGLYPSVTEVIKIKSAPGLERWKQNEMMMAALTLPRKDNEPDKAFLSRVIKDSQETALIARDQGSAIHDAIEKTMNGINPVSHNMIGTKIRKVIVEKFGEGGWVTEKPFGYNGYGGKVDLHRTTDPVVIDYKTKEVLEEGKKYAYDEQAMQLEAYRVGLGLPLNTRCFNLFVGWQGQHMWHEWTREELDRAGKMFNACFELWKLDKKFNPTEAA